MALIKQWEKHPFGEVVQSLRADGARDYLFAFWRKMLAALKGLQHKHALNQFAPDFNTLSVEFQSTAASPDSDFNII